MPSGHSSPDWLRWSSAALLGTRPNRDSPAAQVTPTSKAPSLSRNRGPASRSLSVVENGYAGYDERTARRSAPSVRRLERSQCFDWCCDPTEGGHHRRRLRWTRGGEGARQGAGKHDGDRSPQLSSLPAAALS